MNDRNFDSLAERFEKRIHQGLKGNIRREVIWRDLTNTIPNIDGAIPLRILDLGGGLGHFSIELGKYGHKVTYNDLSHKMMLKAQQLASENGVIETIEWSNEPYQDLLASQPNSFDLVLSHAVIEWLEKPEELIAIIGKLLSTSGYLSLCHYNPAGLIYRNLICGNFKYLNELDSYQTDPGSLTPQNPCTMEQVEQWLTESGFSIQTLSGIRTFSDYVLKKRGGNASEEAVLNAELEYSQSYDDFWCMS